MATSALKTTIADLALFGGNPLFDEALHVGRPNIGNQDRFMEHIQNIFERRWFTNDGPLVQEFEKRIEKLLGVKHCIAICNGTIALEIAIRALELTGEVILPSFTFIATAHALQWQEITPVFCDVAPGQHHLNPQEIEKLITPRTSGIIGVHVWGESYGLEEINEIATHYDLHLLFDAAHAFVASHGGKMIGNFGEAEIFSFHATKFFNTFEGGAITTNNDELATKIRYMRNFGFAYLDKVEYLGINGKMHEVSAAMGLTNLESIDDFIKTNRANYTIYQDNLRQTAGIKVYTYNEHEKRNYQYIIVEIDENVTGLNRDILVRILQAENVLARRYFYPGCHRMQPYQAFFPNAHLLLPETEKLTQRVMSLPNGTSVTHADIRKICGIIRFALENRQSIRARLEE